MLNTSTEVDLPEDFVEIAACVEIDTKFLKKDADEDKRKKVLEVNKPINSHVRRSSNTQIVEIFLFYLSTRRLRDSTTRTRIKRKVR